MTCGQPCRYCWRDGEPASCQDRQVERGVVAELDGERLVGGSVPVEAGSVVAAQRDLDLVARPEQRGYRQQLHGDVEVLPGRSSGARRAGWARRVRSSRGGGTGGSLR